MTMQERQRQMIRRRENFLSILSHDIRSSLTVTLMTFDAIKAKTPMAPERMENRLNLARESIVRIDRLLRRLRSLLAVQGGKVQIRKEAYPVPECAAPG